MKAVGAQGDKSLEEDNAYALFDEEVQYISIQVAGSPPRYQGANQGSWRPQDGNQGWRERERVTIDSFQTLDS